MAGDASVIRVPPAIATTCQVVVDDGVQVCGQTAVLTIGTQLDWLSEHDRLASPISLDIGICDQHAQRMIGWWRPR